MDLFGQICLLLCAMVAASHSLPEELKILPDASVFEMKAPKEFVDLFKPDDRKNLNNPMKISTIVEENQAILATSTLLPDPSVFQLISPKQIPELFQFKEKTNRDSESKANENLVVSSKEVSIKDEKDETPKETKPLYDPMPNVFQMKPPQMFLDLFKPDDSKKLNNPMKFPFASMSSLSLPNMSTYLPDASVFEMKPPKEFLELFQNKRNVTENTASNKESVSETSNSIANPTSIPVDSKVLTQPIVSESKPSDKIIEVSHLKDKENPAEIKDNPIKLPITGVPDKKPLIDPSVFEMRPPKEFMNLFHFKDEKEDRPIWSFQINNFGEDVKYPNWFFLPTYPQLSGSQGNDEDLNDIEVKIKKSKNKKGESNNETPKDIKIEKTSAEVNSNAFNNDLTTIIDKLSHDEKDVKTNEYSDAIKDPLEKVDNAKADSKLEDKPPKLSVLDNSHSYPAKISNPQSQYYGYGNNMVFMSAPYLPQYQGPRMSNMQSQSYEFVYSQTPNNQIRVSPYKSEQKPLPYIAPKTDSKPSDKKIPSIDHSSGDYITGPGNTNVAAVIVLSKENPQAKSVVSRNNMVIISGNKLANIDQNKSVTPNPNGEENNVPDRRTDSVNQRNIPMVAPNYNEAGDYPVAGDLQPHNPQPLVSGSYQSNSVPYHNNGGLNYVLPNGVPSGQAMYSQNYQPNPQQTMLPMNQASSGYDQNVYALVPITSYVYQRPYYSNPQPSYQMGGPVYNLIPAYKNVLLTTKDEDDE